jgi:hypothetical protein
MKLSDQSTIPGSGDDDHDILAVFMGRERASVLRTLIGR